MKMKKLSSLSISALMILLAGSLFIISCKSTEEDEAAGTIKMEAGFQSSTQIDITVTFVDFPDKLTTSDVESNFKKPDSFTLSPGENEIVFTIADEDFVFDEDQQKLTLTLEVTEGEILLSTSYKLTMTGTVFEEEISSETLLILSAKVGANYAFKFTASHAGPRVIKLELAGVDSTSQAELSNFFQNEEVENFLENAANYSVSLIGSNRTVQDAKVEGSEDAIYLTLDDYLPANIEATFGVNQFVYSDSNEKEHNISMSDKFTLLFKTGSGESKTLHARGDLFVGTQTSPSTGAEMPQKITIPAGKKWLAIRVIEIIDNGGGNVGDSFGSAYGSAASLSQVYSNNIHAGRYIVAGDEYWWFLAGVFGKNTPDTNVTASDSLRFKMETKGADETTSKDVISLANQQMFYVGSGKRTADDTTSGFALETDSLRYVKIPTGANFINLGVNDTVAAYHDNGNDEFKVEVFFYDRGY